MPITLLMARTNGNHDLHRFLAIADGVVRAQGRKIIFTTSRPNIGDLDEALLRPGRCFQVVRTRLLNCEQADRLIARLCPDDAHQRELARSKCIPAGTRSVSVCSEACCSGCGASSSCCSCSCRANRAAWALLRRCFSR